MKDKKYPNKLKKFIRFEQESIAQFFGLSLIIYALVVSATLLVAFGRYEKINEEKRIHTDGFTLVNLLTAFARSNLESEKIMDLYQVADIVEVLGRQLLLQAFSHPGPKQDENGRRIQARDELVPGGRVLMGRKGWGADGVHGVDYGGKEMNLALLLEARTRGLSARDPPSFEFAHTCDC